MCKEDNTLIIVSFDTDNIISIVEDKKQQFMLKFLMKKESNTFSVNIKIKRVGARVRLCVMA